MKLYQTFEEIKGVCIFFYEFDSQGQIRRGQDGRLEYLTHDLIYLSRAATANKIHYIYIKSTDHFFNLQKCSFDKDKRFNPVCAKRLDIKADQSHASKCYEYARHSDLIKLHEEENAHMMFKSHKHKLKRPYIVYAGTERSLAPTGLADNTHKHVPNSACFYFVCDYEPTHNRLWYDLGPDCIVYMLVELTKRSDECIAKMRKNQEMNMTPEDHTNFKNTTRCSNWAMPFNERAIKHRDHCHRT